MRHTKALKRLRLVIASLALLALSPFDRDRSLLAQEADLVIVNGRVMDPESGLDAVRTVVVTGDRITEITGRPVRAKRTIDASGLVVAPGFVDILAHLRPSHEPQRYKIKDGVTTVISMHGGPVDIRGWYGAFETDGALLFVDGSRLGHTPTSRSSIRTRSSITPHTSTRPRIPRGSAT